eukprot:Seg934.7 transcript_id=Seg934.7/GoldUCD/mRNA.D3Y31 product="putative protein" protein_id=Seg934.7/GoldUCD/D3Y31
MELLTRAFTTAQPLVKVAIIDVSIQWGLWAVAAYFKTEVFYDLAGSSTFLLLSWQTLNWGKAYHTRQVIQTLCVSAWSLRLGSYLFVRIINDKGVDKRFNRARDKPVTFFVFWTIQAVWIWITLAPTAILNTKRQDAPIGLRDYIGWGLWIVGFLLEAIADKQKSEFKSDPNNQGKWIKSGLWGVSRHPNYLGEMVLWTGLFISASPVFKGKEWLSVISPAFVVFLLTQVSGVPLLERQANKRWGQLPEYQNYKKKTACLIPYIW